MGTFDDWQAQKDSQYLTLTDYITELAKAENSSIKATLLYLINHKENLKLYKKSMDGNYHKIAYDDLFDCFEDNALDDALKELLTYIEQTPYFHDFNFIGNDFSKKLYKNVYVKKVGLSRIEPVAPSEPKAGGIKSHFEPIELGEHQLLMKDYPSFTPHELACFLSDKDPDYINNNNFTDFNLSERLVYKALSNGYLSKNDNDEIKTQEAKEYLYSIGKIYKGFNDNLPPATADKIGHATITQTTPTDSQLSQQVASQQPTIESQAKEIADLKVQLASASETINQQVERIAELETKLKELQKSTNDNDVLSDRSRIGHLITIALLVDIIKTTPQGIDKKGKPMAPKYASQNDIYEKIEEYGVKGQSAKTLEIRFADANKELKDIKPDHKFT